MAERTSGEEGDALRLRETEAMLRLLSLRTYSGLWPQCKKKWIYLGGRGLRVLGGAGNGFGCRLGEGVGIIVSDSRGRVYIAVVDRVGVLYEN